MKKHLIISITLASLLSGCTIPGVDEIKNIKIPDLNLEIGYKSDTQEGNVFTKSQLNSLAVGMNFAEVVEIMGSPAIHDPFHDYRLDYINITNKSGKRSIYRATVFLNRYTELVDKIETSGVIPN